MSECACLECKFETETTNDLCNECLACDCKGETK